MKHLHIEHRTLFHYQNDVLLAHHLAHLRPIKTMWQKPMSYQLRVDPLPDVQREDQDVFGNNRCFFSIIQPHRELSVTACSDIQKLPQYSDFNAAETSSWEVVKESLTYSLDLPYQPASEFVWPSPLVPWLPELRDYAKPSFTRGKPLALACLDLKRRIHADFEVDNTPGELHTSLAQVMQRRRGVSQDLAHVMIGCLRAMGLAARFVNGYVLDVIGQQELASDRGSHQTTQAWVSVYCPQAPGLWLDLDPVNDTIADISHVCLAIGRDFSDASPLRSILRGGGVRSLRSEIQVRETQL